MEKALHINVIVESEEAVEHLGKLLHQCRDETRLMLMSHRHSASAKYNNHFDAEFSLLGEGTPTTREMCLLFAFVAMADGLVTSILFGDEDIVSNMRRREQEEPLKPVEAPSGVIVASFTRPALALVSEDDDSADSSIEEEPEE